MNIGIDIDGVIVDTICFTANELSKHYGFNITPGEIAHSLGKLEGVEQVFIEKGEHLLCSLAPRQDAAEVIAELGRNHEIYLISARYDKHYDATCKWLDEHQICCAKTFFTQGKSKVDLCRKLKIDLFIEDSAKNALELAKEGINVVLFKTDYNYSVNMHNIVFCESWKDIGEWISGLEYEEE